MGQDFGSGFSGSGWVRVGLGSAQPAFLWVEPNPRRPLIPSLESVPASAVVAAAAVGFFIWSVVEFAPDVAKFLAVLLPTYFWRKTLQ